METSATTSEAKKDINVYALITDKVIEQLNNQTVPWYKTWGEAGTPLNLVTKNPYTGINALILGMQGFQKNVFLSYKQVTEIGAGVKHRENGCPVVYWPPMPDEPKVGSNRPKYYKVYNISQCENIPAHYLQAVPKLGGGGEDLAAAVSIVKGMPNPPKIMHQGENAYYEVLEDVIYLPKRGRKKDGDYYANLFRLLVHATGNDLRLSRKEVVKMSAAAGNELFSKEDLVGMIGAYFLCGITGIKPAWGASPVFLEKWKEEFKKNEQLIFIAAKEAQKAVNYINYVTEAKKEDVGDE